MASRRVLITGAGSGLGREMAKVYASRGDRVACVDLYADRAEETMRMLPGGGHLALVADVGSDAAMAALKGQVVGAWDGLDVLVNNAGIASGGECAHVSMAEWQRTLNINLMGVVRGVREFVPLMERQGRGHVLSTASFAGLAGAPGLGAYGVAKAAVIALSEGLRAELQPKGIGVSVLCPSFFKTRLLETATDSAALPLKHVAAKLMEQSPIDAAEVARHAVEESERGRFLLLPHKDTRMRVLMKRLFPEFYFRQVLKYVEKARRRGGG
jgi:NAD(P)-dependent dehydrogenase (short-subunit alcohol dehydrogenase family)